MPISSMPIAVPSVDDWLVGVRYIGWDNVERVRVIAVSTGGKQIDAKAAATHALESIKKRGSLPPVVKNVEARTAIELGITKLFGRKQAFLDKVKL